MTEAAERSKPWGSAIGTVMTYLVLGPPLGAMVLILLLTAVPGLALPSPENTGLGTTVAVSLGIALFAVPFTYILGGLQALFCGVVLAAYGWLKGRPPLWVGLIASLLAFVVSYSVDIFGTFADSNHIVLVMVITHLLPTILCWLIVRTFWMAI